jgi:hypothetical protein
LGTLIKGINVYNNAKKLTKEGVRQEGFSIFKSALGASTGIDVSGVANVLFPKQTGRGQTTPTVASPPRETAKTNTTDQRQSALAKNPGARTALIDLAIKSGVVAPGANAAAAVDSLVSSGRNAKLNGLADKVISTAG